MVLLHHIHCTAQARCIDGEIDGESEPLDLSRETYTYLEAAPDQVRAVSLRDRDSRNLSSDDFLKGCRLAARHRRFWSPGSVRIPSQAELWEGSRLGWRPQSRFEHLSRLVGSFERWELGSTGTSLALHLLRRARELARRYRWTEHWTKVQRRKRFRPGVRTTTSRFARGNCAVWRDQARSDQRPFRTRTPGRRLPPTIQALSPAPGALMRAAGARARRRAALRSSGTHARTGGSRDDEDGHMGKSEDR